eukprot:scaffold90493_cov63-Phaeocystis_antarctica.AAC.2
MPCVARGAVAGGRRGGTRRTRVGQAAGVVQAGVADGPSCGAGERAADGVRGTSCGFRSRRLAATTGEAWFSGSCLNRGDTTTRTEIETAGSGKDLGFWLWPLGAGRCKAAPYAIEGPHPSPAASSATVEKPRAQTESRCTSEK